MTKEKALDLAIEKIEEDIKHITELKEEDISMCFFKVGSDLTCEQCGECFRSNPNWEQDFNNKIKDLEEAKNILSSIKAEVR